ncbi:hypothetical protein VTO42DRAFT_3324 [Malbranchea cinnamomea]
MNSLADNGMEESSLLGLQALILCGPGLSFNTFTSNPDESPKALVPIANRPMVWYPLDWCHRTGVTDITLITPATSRKALEAALQKDPYLKSLPSHPHILAPAGLTHTMGTGELLRLPEVQACIKQDFMILPCDLICEQPGEEIIGSWIETQGALAGATDGNPEENGISSRLGVNGEKSGRRGGLGVWYSLPPNPDNAKEEVADFLVVTQLEKDQAALVNGLPSNPLTARDLLFKVAYAAPMDSMRDKMDAKGMLNLRQSLLKRESRVKILTQCRDAHLYIFPYWVKEMAAMNEKFESISEDLIGWWAKTGWQEGLANKLRIRETAHHRAKNEGFESQGGDILDHIEERIDLVGMATTQRRVMFDIQQNGSQALPARQRPLARADTLPDISQAPFDKKLPVPELLGYLHQNDSNRPMIRRIDSTALLLSMTLRLAKLDPATDPEHPFVHEQKIASPELVAQRTTITKNDCLIGVDTVVEEKCLIKETVIGANCKIASGARLTKCVIMDGVEIGERCTLVGCIVGRRTKIGRECDLRECEVQDGNVLASKTEARGEKFMVFDGMADAGVTSGDEEDLIG